MKLQTESINVASVVVNTAASNITKIHGFFRGSTADRWLQVFDAKALPADGATPLRVWPLYQTAPFGEGFIDDPVLCGNGVVFAVSSTQSTLTASADGMDIFVNGETLFRASDYSAAGDYTTDTDLVQVWADADGPKRLTRLEVSDPNSAGPAYVQIHAGDTPATDKIVASYELPVDGDLNLFFGGGLTPFRMVGATAYDGCTVAISSTRNTYTNWNSDDFRIKASYR